MTTPQDLEPAHLEAPSSLCRIENSRLEQSKKRFVERPFLDLFLPFICLASAWVLLALFQPIFDIGNMVAQLDNLAIIVSLPTLVFGLVALGWRLRWRINHHKAWRNNACPSCQSEQLKRKRRSQRDRFIGRLGIPVRRYVCADCSWAGLLIDEKRIL